MVDFGTPFAEGVLAALDAEAPAYSARNEARGRPSLDLAKGEVRLPWPKELLAKASAGVRTEDFMYADPQGTIELRDAYVRWATRDCNGGALGPENVMVTSGGKQAIWAALLLSVRPGMKILIPSPGWALYRVWGRALNAHVETYESEGNFFGELSERIGQGDVDIVIINSPANPTGFELAPEEVRHLAELAVERNVRIVSDEVYREFGRERGGFLRFVASSNEMIAVADSVSKIGAAAGLRVGFLVASARFVRSALKLRSTIDSCPPGLTQRFAQILLTEGDQFREDVRRSAALKTSKLRRRLEREGLEVVSDGGIYVWARHFDRNASDSLMISGAVIRGMDGKLFGARERIRLCPIIEDPMLSQLLQEE